MGLDSLAVVLYYDDDQDATEESFVGILSRNFITACFNNDAGRPGKITMFHVNTSKNEGGEFVPSDEIEQVYVEAIQEQHLVGIDGAVFVNAPRYDLIRFEEFCNWAGMKLFLGANVYGLVARLLYARAKIEDPQDANDKGENKPRMVIEPNTSMAIRKIQKNGCVFIEEDAPFVLEEENEVVFSAVVGLEGVDDRAFVVTECDADAKTFRVKLSSMADRKLFAKIRPGTGVVDRVQNTGDEQTMGEPKPTRDYFRLREVFILPDAENVHGASVYNVEDSAQLHCALQGISQFEQYNGYLPGENNATHVSEVVNLAQKYLDENKIVNRIAFGSAFTLEGVLDTRICEMASCYSSRQHPSISSFMARQIIGLVVQNRNVEHVFQPGRQQLLFAGFSGLGDKGALPSYQELLEDEEFQEHLDAELEQLNLKKQIV
mmetsp:Transcript_4566/g.7934  ORF Transcript_4566/g.7934 Transcript_4566/m.7934 type:complete len:433 (-) Transcript_4566:2126-3424(-)